MYWNNYTNMLPNHLMNMYPDIYRRLYPMIESRCEFFNNTSNYMAYGYPDEEMINSMVEDIYDQYKRQRIEEGYSTKDFEYLSRGRHHDPCKDLIKILIIKEIIDRCRRPYCRPRRRYPWWY